MTVANPISIHCCNKSSGLVFAAGGVEQCAWRRGVCDISGGGVGEPSCAAVVARGAAAAAGLHLLPARCGVFSMLFGGSFLHHLRRKDKFRRGRGISLFVCVVWDHRRHLRVGQAAKP